MALVNYSLPFGAASPTSWATISPIHASPHAVNNLYEPNGHHQENVLHNDDYYKNGPYRHQQPQQQQHSSKTVETICHLISKIITIIIATVTHKRRERGLMVKTVIRNHHLHNSHKVASKIRKPTTDITITDKALEKILIRHNRNSHSLHNNNNKPPKHPTHDPL